MKHSIGLWLCLFFSFTSLAQSSIVTQEVPSKIKWEGQFTRQFQKGTAIQVFNYLPQKQGGLFGMRLKRDNR